MNFRISCSNLVIKILLLLCFNAQVPLFIMSWISKSKKILPIWNKKAKVGVSQKGAPLTQFRGIRSRNNLHLSDETSRSIVHIYLFRSRWPKKGSTEKLIWFESNFDKSSILLSMMATIIIFRQNELFDLNYHLVQMIMGNEVI